MFDLPLPQIKGIAYWDNGIKLNQDREENSDLDSLAWPSHELFLDAHKQCVFPRGICAQVMTSRGCNYRCVFCSNTTHGKGVRFRDIAKVFDEIDYLINKLGVRYVEIIDESFTSFPERVKEFCKGIIKKNYKGVYFVLNNGIRPDISDTSMYKLLKKAGFGQLRFGIESGSQVVLDAMQKDFTLEKVKSAVNSARDVGIKAAAFFMFGFPSETQETMRQTIDFAKSLPLCRAYFAIATPFPGSPLHDIVKKRGRFLKDMDLESTSILKACFQIPGLDPQEVEDMLKQAYKEFYLRPVFLSKRIILEGPVLLTMLAKRLRIETNLKYGQKK
ncbi:MAG: radical SAM protein [Candidatus Gygaella obscura]|nr:radical SAM protein [Candidatus Gygaella obscura]